MSRVSHTNQVRPVRLIRGTTIYSVESCAQAGHPLTTKKDSEWWQEDKLSYECPCRTNVIEIFYSRIRAGKTFQ